MYKKSLRIIGILLSAMMIMMSFVGCKKEESSYLKEVMKMAEVKNGTASIELSVNLPKAEGELSLGLEKIALKMDSQTQDEKLSKIDISVDLGNGYQNVTDLIASVEEKDVKFYINAFSALNFVKNSQLISGDDLIGVDAMATMWGINEQNPYVFFSQEGLTTLTSSMAILPEQPDSSLFQDVEKMNKILNEQINPLVKSLDEKLAGTTAMGVDDDYYTFKLNNENVKDLSTKLIEWAKENKAAIVKLVNELGNAELKESDIDSLSAENIDTEADGNFKIESKIKNEGKGADIKSEVLVDASVEGATINMKATFDGAAKAEVKVPENAVDIMQQLSKLQQLSGGVIA